MRHNIAVAALSALVITATAGATAACGSDSGDSSSKTITVAYQKFGAFIQTRPADAEGQDHVREGPPRLHGQAHPDRGGGERLLHQALADEQVGEDRARRHVRGHVPGQHRHPGRLPGSARRLPARTGRTGASSATRPRPRPRRRTARPTASRWAPTRARSGTTRICSSKAGLAVPWEPKTWDDILAAARTIKAKVPGVTPFNVYSGKGAGEGATMQGFEMLLYGTKHTLYDDSVEEVDHVQPGLHRLAQLHQDDLQREAGPGPAGRSRPQLGHQGVHRTAADQQARHRPRRLVADRHLAAPPAPSRGRSGRPCSAGRDADPARCRRPARRACPAAGCCRSARTRRTRRPPSTSSTLSLNKENTLAYDIAASQIAERDDVAADPAYLNSNPTLKFFTDLVSVTHFRPAYPDVPASLQRDPGGHGVGDDRPADRPTRPRRPMPTRSNPRSAVPTK